MTFAPKKPEEYGYRFRNCPPALKRKEENNELARRWYETKDPALREELIVRNRSFIGFIQSRYQVPLHLQRRDLIGEAFIGLIEAVDRYDGGNFVSYVSKNVRGKILNYLSANWDVIRIPSPVKKEVFELEREDSPLKYKTHKRAKMVLEAKERRIPLKRLEICQRDETNRRQDIQDMLHLIDEEVDSFDERERIVYEQCFMTRSNPATLKEIAEMIGVSGERVRQIKEDLLFRLYVAIQDN